LLCIQDYNEAEKYFDANIKATSDMIIGDVAIYGTEAASYKLYEACGHKGIDPAEMVAHIAAAVWGKKEPETQKAHRKKRSKQQETGQNGKKLGELLANGMAERIDELDGVDD